MTEKEIQEYKDKYKYNFHTEEDTKKLISMIEEDVDELNSILKDLENEEK